MKVPFKVMSVTSSSMLLDSSSLSMSLCAESIRTACRHIILGYVSLHMPTTSLTFCVLFSCEPLYCSEMLQDKVIVLCIQFCAFTWKLIHSFFLNCSLTALYPSLVWTTFYHACTAKYNTAVCHMIMCLSRLKVVWQTYPAAITIPHHDLT